MKIRNALGSAAAAVVMGLTLAGCGGGGGGSDAPAGPNTAEGFWSGPLSTGYQVNLAVLENGATWGVYSSGSVIYGAFRGTLTGQGNSLSGSGSDYYFVNNTVTPGTVGGTVIARSSMSLATSTGVTGNLVYGTTYDTPASLASLAGSYSVNGRTGSYSLATRTVTISSSGSFAFVDNSCTVAGSATPRPSGKNIFDLTISFTGVCVFPSGSTVSGVAYLDTSVSPSKFLALGLTGDQSDGLILLGTRLP